MSAFTLAVLLAQAALAGTPPDFEYRAEPGWLTRDLWASQYPLFALVLPTPGPAMPVISVEKYPLGNPLFPNARSFLASIRRPSLEKEQRARAAGEAAVSGERLTLWKRPGVPGPEGSGPLEEHLVILDAGSAYYVLRLRSPLEQARDRRKDFDRFLASFKLRPGRR